MSWNENKTPWVERDVYTGCWYGHRLDGEKKVFRHYMTAENWANGLKKELAEDLDENLDKARVHHIKILPEWFKLAELGIKNFEVREDDRRYEVGDTVVMHEIDPENLGGGETGREIVRRIALVLARCAGVDRDFVILALVPLAGEGAGK